jgi:hypothetical protein
LLVDDAVGAETDLFSCFVELRGSVTGLVLPSEEELT